MSYDHGKERILQETLPLDSSDSGGKATGRTFLVTQAWVEFQKMRCLSWRMAGNFRQKWKILFSSKEGFA